MRRHEFVVDGLRTKFAEVSGTLFDYPFHMSVCRVVLVIQDTVIQGNIRTGRTR